MNNYPNPWDFSNIDKNTYSFDKKYKIEFDGLNEIAMGSPIGGKCYLTYTNKRKLLNDWCGGPILWENHSHKVALPIWTRKFFKGTVQQIGIADLQKMTLTIYKETFRVLDLRTFDGNIINGYDSPIHKIKTLNLDITKMKVEKIIEL
jgi:hypothetical protein